MPADTRVIPPPTVPAGPIFVRPNVDGGPGPNDFGFDQGAAPTGFNADAQGIAGGIPREYRIDTRYDRRSGAYLVPVCGGLEPIGDGTEEDPLAKPQLIVLHSPYTLKTTDWTVERWAPGNSLPPLPLAQGPNIDKERLLTDQVTVTAPQPGGAEGRMMRISGTYFYGLTDAVGSGSELSMGWNPHDGSGAGFGDNKIPATGWFLGIINPISTYGEPPTGGED